MKKLVLIMAIFMCVAFGEQVCISSEMRSWEYKKDKDRVLLEVKGNNKREVIEELIPGCVKYHKKKKHRIGDETKYYVRYSSDDTLIAWCEFLDTLYDGSYVIQIVWKSDVSILRYIALEDKNTKKIDILLLEDWSRSR